MTLTCEHGVGIIWPCADCSRRDEIRAAGGHAPPRPAQAPELPRPRLIPDPERAIGAEGPWAGVKLITDEELAAKAREAARNYAPPFQASDLADFVAGRGHAKGLEQDWELTDQMCLRAGPNGAWVPDGVFIEVRVGPLGARRAAPLTRGEAIQLRNKLVRILEG